MSNTCAHSPRLDHQLVMRAVMESSTPVKAAAIVARTGFGRVQVICLAHFDASFQVQIVAMMYRLQAEKARRQLMLATNYFIFGGRMLSACTPAT